MSPLPELRYETDPDAQQHPPDEPPTVAQVEFVKLFDTPTDGVITGERVVYLRTGGAVRIIAAIDEKTGQEAFFPISQVPAAVHPSDLPHQPLDDAAAFDLAEQDPDHPFARARTVAAVTEGVDLNAQTRHRGGDPNARINRTETGGWFGKPTKPKK